MGPSAKTVFGLACTGKKVRLLVEVFRLFENFILKRLFSQSDLRVIES